jgi:hypothetical protein
MWAEQDPGADIVYVSGLSRACGSDHGIVVLDGDDEEACARIVEVFGDTPGKVKTRRGCHNLYQATGGDLGKLTSLKKFGINADVKHGNSIVVAPPSRHQDDRGFAVDFKRNSAAGRLAGEFRLVMTPGGAARGQEQVHYGDQPIYNSRVGNDARTPRLTRGRSRLYAVRAGARGRVMGFQE